MLPEAQVINNHVSDVVKAMDKATCCRCNRKGHFISQCLSKQASATTSELIAGPFVGTLSTREESIISIQLEGKQMPFKIDTWGLR